MTASIRPFTLDDSDRIAQLSLRSNQFNLRTIRYSKDEIVEMTKSPNYLTFSVRLNDKFGDYALVAIAIIKIMENNESFLDTFLMSCRVLKRGLEDLLMNKIIELLSQNSVKILIGEYLPTLKNNLVKDFLSDHQFVFDQKKNQNVLQIDNYKKIENHIYES